MAIPRKRYWCYVDICTEGIQFCDHSRDQQRCRFCSDFADDCFTNHQQQNCTQYCMGRWFEEHCQVKQEQGEFTTTAVIALILLGVAVIIILMLVFSHIVQYNGVRIVDHMRSKCCTSTRGDLSVQDYTAVSGIEHNREEAEGTENDANRRQERALNGAFPNGNVRTSSLAIHNGNIRSNNEAIRYANTRGNSNDEDTAILEVETGNNVPVAQDTTTQASVYINRCPTNSDRQPISGSSTFHDRTDDFQNVPQISAPHNCPSISSPRRELSSPVGSDCQPAMGYISSGLDTGYTSTPEDLDQTDLKQSQQDRHSETDRLLYTRRSQEVGQSS